jgi:hypothetical protein
LLVRGTRVSRIDELAIDAPAAVADKLAHHPKLESAGRIDPGSASIQGATGNRRIVRHAVIVTRAGPMNKLPGWRGFTPVQVNLGYFYDKKT